MRRLSIALLLLAASMAAAKDKGPVLTGRVTVQVGETWSRWHDSTYCVGPVGNLSCGGSITPATVVWYEAHLLGGDTIRRDNDLTFSHLWRKAASDEFEFQYRNAKFNKAHTEVTLEILNSKGRWERRWFRL